MTDADRDAREQEIRDARAKGLAGVVTYPDVDFLLDQLAAERLAREKEAGNAVEAYGYLSRLFLHLAPKCLVLPTLAGLATQIDNYIAGQQQRIEKLDKELAAERQARAALEQALREIAEGRASADYARIIVHALLHGAGEKP